MATISPMDVLRDLAQQKLDDTTSHLGKVQQDYSRAVTQLEQLEAYELEYQQTLQSNMANKGISVVDWVNHQSFIDSLGKVVFQHTGHVTQCKKSVDLALSSWRSDKQRLNSFDTLKSRAEEVRTLKENRQEQKLMDEFAQRASLGKKVL
ncbi:flagellar export protein FliJ [Obesumbacterium proteus]|uniref:Flagellar FliJ protein n=1 Tax=Obesumbacterium proteus ATCC 12841 TaxID=1354268 RepID=A0AA91IQ29_9GAMM|nr:flagellar export protein FliJ [Obesumbacterium proteus]OAT59350.1 FliJ family flagellar protein [Obesumbacterium proteus ATCC 12841]